MINKKSSQKKRHPYAALAMFTLAAASVINITNKAKSFVMEKTEAVTDFFKKKTKN